MPAPRGFLHEELAEKLNDAVSASRGSSRGVSRVDSINQYKASKWLIEALYQGYCCLPRLPVGLPRGKSYYLQSAAYGLPFGYDVTDRVLRAAESLGFVNVKTGRYNPAGKGEVTRLYPSGHLLSSFQQLGVVWQRLSPPNKNQGILINEGIGREGRRLAKVTDHCEVAQMQKNLYTINLFLSKQCIYMNLPNSAFSDPADKYLRKNPQLPTLQRGSENSLPIINFQNVFLHRIFTQNSFKAGHQLEGGRFYHGWWQNIRREFRSRVLINNYVTAECDYSGMAINCLYARKGAAIGASDPYEIGIIYKGKNDPRRDLVKRYIVAILNDKTGKYSLTKGELDTLEVTHKQLSEMVRKRHSAISDCFNTGVGLQLQYDDSRVAERIMLRFAGMGEVCLPIHDSFIVRRKLLHKLEEIMKEEYERLFGKSISLKYELPYDGLGIGEPDKDLLSPNSRLPAADFHKGFKEHLDKYSIMMKFHDSWKKQTLSPAELARQQPAWERVAPLE